MSNSLRQKIHGLFRGQLVAVLIGLLVHPLMAASRTESLFQDAMMKESGERDPEGALALYRQVIDEAGNDHRLIAKARLHMGNCLERLGKPKEAEAVYLQIVQDSAISLTEAVTAAQANLEKLEAQDRKALQEAERAKELQQRSKPMVLVKEFHATRFSGVGGIGGFKSGSNTAAALDLAVRYRLSAIGRPSALFAEVGGFLPLGGSDINESKPFNAQTTDQVTLKFRDQIRLALIAELPHGLQRRYIPEIGAGAALTQSEIQYTSGSSGSESHNLWSPYFVMGLHLNADRRVSFLLEGSYTANPYAKTIQIQSPTHTQTLDFPTSIWTIGIQTQVKLGSTKVILRPKQ